MTEKILPAHIEFASWFIKIRWIAICLLLIITCISAYVFMVEIQQDEIFLIAIILLLTNLYYLIKIRKLRNSEAIEIFKKVRKNVHNQVIVDFIALTVILHYSGGIENPFVFCYVFHMIVVSTILSPRESYLFTALALLLIGLLAFAECFNVIRHFPLNGFVKHDLYANQFYIYTTAPVFILTSYFLVSLTSRLAKKSRLAEDAYIKANTELRKQDQVKNEYVMRLTHEIKGHLTAVHASLSVLKENIAGALNEKQSEFVNRSYDRTTQLSGFVSDLFDLTMKRLEKADQFVSFSLKESIEKVLAEVSILAGDRSITLRVEVDQSIGKLEGVQFSIEELFTNLLVNAIKYTPEKGEVILSGSQKQDRYIFRISDNGIGIPAGEIPKVFDELYRAENIKGTDISGSGLGLSIAKQIVTNHGGKIWVESIQDKGTCFTFFLLKKQSALVQPPDQ